MTADGEPATADGDDETATADGDEPAAAAAGRTSPPVASAFADGPALVPYLVAGDPGPEATVEYVRALARGGADAVELGLPFSEPIAEGPTIREGIARALDAGMTPAGYLELVEGLDVDVPLLCMTYYNLLYRYGRHAGGDSGGPVGPDGAATAGGGPAAFVEAAAAAGLSGLIVPDLPVEESGPLRAACEAHGLDLVFMVAPTTDDARRERILAAASGFVYVQARLGTTGARTDLSDATFESLDRLGDVDVPTAVGFGVSEPEHARAIVAGGADGVVVGSALVDVVADGVEAGRPTAGVADELERTVAGLSAGAADGAASRVPEPEEG